MPVLDTCVESALLFAAPHFVTLSRIPTGRVVEVGTQVTV